MNVDIRDVKAVQMLRPLEVAVYLRAKGWVEQKSFTPKASIWTTAKSKHEFEALVPLDQAVRDYSLRMGDVLRTLAAVEDRSQSQIYADLLTTCADVVRIRIDDPDLQDGTLPMEFHAQVAQKARDLVMAAACAATEHRSVWHTKKPDQAVEHVRKMRIGQSERGSYIMTLISRVSPALHVPNNGRLFEIETPFERRVIQTLASSLEQLDLAAQKAATSGEFASFEESVSKGVNANLCDAVVGLWGDDDAPRNLEFLFSWSPSRPVESQIPSKVRFSPDRIPVIREAARVMRDRAPVSDFELEGAVVICAHQPGQTEGKITVIGQVDGKPKRVALELRVPDYHRAVEAHKEGRMLRCFGSLVRDGRSYTLQSPRELEFVEE